MNARTPIDPQLNPLAAVEQEIDSLTPVNPGLLPGSRRGFLQASALAGFAAAVVPTGALQAQTITTDTNGLDAAMVQVPTSNGNIPAYMAKPAGKSGLATVVVLHEIFGVHEHIKDVCQAGLFGHCTRVLSPSG